MSVRFVLISLLLLSVCAARAAAQAKLDSVAAKDAVKITLETKKFPVGFAGHDPEILFKNLQTLIAAARKPKARKTAPSLGGKAVYGKLTVDDLYAFTVPPVDYIAGRNRANDKLSYRANLYRLRGSGEFPEPEREFVGTCGYGTGSGGSLPLVNSRTELLRTGAVYDTEAAWLGGIFHLQTVVPKANRRNYKGYNVGKECEEFFVPSPQIHYELSFVREQPFLLSTVDEDDIFWLEDYSETTIGWYGIAGWTYDAAILGDKWYEDRIEPIFIVKLTAPYSKTETKEMLDGIERKPHRAIRNKISVDLVAVWAYSQKTGAIVSKNAGDTVKK